MGTLVSLNGVNVHMVSEPIPGLADDPYYPHLKFYNEEGREMAIVGTETVVMEGRIYRTRWEQAPIGVEVVKLVYSGCNVADYRNPQVAKLEEANAKLEEEIAKLNGRVGQLKSELFGYRYGGSAEALCSSRVAARAQFTELEDMVMAKVALQGSNSFIIDGEEECSMDEFPQGRPHLNEL